MKRFLKTGLMLLIILFCTTAIQAQSGQRKEILDDLNAVVPGKGKVTVYEDENIKHVLGRSITAPRSVYANTEGARYYKMRGFKIQVFSGNNQRTSKNEAYNKKKLISTAFPDLETVVLFDSPFWRLRVGNFARREEALEAMKKLREQFPSFGREMYVVVDEVKIPVDPSSED